MKMPTLPLIDGEKEPAGKMALKTLAGLGGMALLGLLSGVAKASSTAISTPTDFDSTFGTSYTPSGGAGCLMGLQPHNLTGGLGVRSDFCEDKVETTTDGNTFTDIKPDILNAISSAGLTADGTYLATCDYSNNFDELLIDDVIGGKLFVVGGLSTGTITDVKELQGTPYSCGYIDEATGEYYASADTRGYGEVHKFTESSAPSPIYSYGTDNIANVNLSSSLNQGVFTNVDSSYDVYFDENTASGSSSSATSLGYTGSAFGLFEGHETGGNPVILLGGSSNVEYVELTTTASDPDADADGTPASADCDDSNAAINPSATEVCDGVDNNCDSVTDTDAVDRVTFYADADGDNEGDATSTIESCDVPAGYTTTPGDCDDNNAAINSSAAEVCDGVDNNCDSVTDTDATDKTVWYLDNDEDGLGDSAISQEACDQPEGYVNVGGDPDDSGVEPSCINKSGEGEYQEGDLICLGSGGSAVVGSGDVFYNGSDTVSLEMGDGADLEGLGILDASQYGWRYEATDPSSRGALFLGVSGFAEGDLVGTFEVYESTFIATDALGNTTEMGPGIYNVNYTADSDGDGVVDDLDAFPYDEDESRDADSDGTGDKKDPDDDNDGYADEEEEEAGTDPLDSNSHPTEGGEDSGEDNESKPVETNDTGKKEEERPGKEPEQTGCVTASTPVGQPGNAPWYTIASTLMASGLAMLRRRKTA